jgi:hypothetical protein
LTILEVVAIAATRGIAGVGIGLLVAPRLSHDARNLLGWTLLGIGALSIIPIGAQLLSDLRDRGAAAESVEQLVR